MPSLALKKLRKVSAPYHTYGNRARKQTWISPSTPTAESCVFTILNWLKERTKERWKEGQRYPVGHEVSTRVLCYSQRGSLSRIICIT